MEFCYCGIIEDIILHEDIMHRKISDTCSHVCVEHYKVRLPEVESSTVVNRGQKEGMTEEAA